MPGRVMELRQGGGEELGNTRPVWSGCAPTVTMMAGCEWEGRFGYVRNHTLVVLPVAAEASSELGYAQGLRGGLSGEVTTL